MTRAGMPLGELLGQLGDQDVDTPRRILERTVPALIEPEAWWLSRAPAPVAPVIWPILATARAPAPPGLWSGSLDLGGG